MDDDEDACTGMPRTLYEAMLRNNREELEAMGEGWLYDPSEKEDDDGAS
jgi:hypothetical protein